MKLVMLAPANNVHTVKWANALTGAGYQVHLATLHAPDIQGEPLNQAVQVHQLARGSGGYLSGMFALKRLLKRIQPDILHAHYATGYGLLARLACPRNLPYMLSVWGTDVYEFPFKSALHRWLLRNNLRRADLIGSTSLAMKHQVLKVAGADIKVVVTPFGVDTDKFSPGPRGELNSESQPQAVRIGTVKGLHRRYGIDRLLRLFALAVKNNLLDEHAELVIAGEGPEGDALQTLADALGISQQTYFLGRVKQNDVPAILQSLDVYVALSRFESFGVAILEAGACSMPVIVSDADGPSEVVLHEETGFVCADQASALQALMTLVQKPQLGIQMGQRGREHVRQAYSQAVCTTMMLKAHRMLIEAFADSSNDGQGSGLGS